MIPLKKTESSFVNWSKKAALQESKIFQSQFEEQNRKLEELTRFYSNTLKKGLSSLEIPEKSLEYVEELDFQENLTQSIPSRIKIETPGVFQDIPKSKKIKEVFNVLQFWEGWVTNVKNESFIATIKDNTNLTHPLEEVDILINEVPEPDRDLIEEGAVFYWHIGYRDNLKTGNRERVSSIRFRRMPRWSKKDFNKAEKFAEEWVQVFKPNGNRTQE